MRERALNMTGVAFAGLRTQPAQAAGEAAGLLPAPVVRALRAFWLDGLFTAGQDAFIMAYLPLLAAHLGASATQIGIVSAAQSLGAMLSLYPGALAARRFHSRRRLVLLSMGVGGRLCLLGAALSVALFHGSAALVLVAALFMARAFLGSFAQPAWTAVAADIVPEGLQARFFASRGFGVSLGMMAITPLGGLILDQAGAPGGYVICLAISFALGMVATGLYASIPEPRRATRQSRDERAQRAGPRRLLRNARFRQLLIASCIMQFGTLLAGPFFVVHLTDDLGGSNAIVGFVSMASLLAGLAGQLYFGDRMARVGPGRVLACALFAMPAVPFAWMVIGTPWLALVPNIIGGFAWAAFNLASFQLLLESSEPGNREEYAALYHTAVFAMLFVAPFVGGALADAAGFRLTFFVSGALRVVAAASFVGLLPLSSLAAGNRFASAAPLPSRRR